LISTEIRSGQQFLQILIEIKPQLIKAAILAGWQYSGTNRRADSIKTVIALVGAVLITTGISAVAAENTPSATAPTHTADSMTSGSHAMPDNKQHHLSDRTMPSHSSKCSDDALAKMPQEHRAACGK
jgi:hypothetical protein